MTEKQITASELAGAHIGQTIRFLSVNDDNKIETVVTGRLHLVAHTTNQADITLGAQFAKSPRNYQLAHAQTVIVDPVRHEVRDLAELRKGHR